MNNISVGLRRLVISRAGNRCEYCLLSQTGQEATFHIDHVKSITNGGETVPENLALACVSCSLRKGARHKVVDLDTGKEVTIFNPRTDTWTEHFTWNGVRVVGLTSKGRATIDALAMNRPLILAIRQEELTLDRH